MGIFGPVLDQVIQSLRYCQRLQQKSLLDRTATAKTVNKLRGSEIY